MIRVISSGPVLMIKATFMPIAVSSVYMIPKQNPVYFLIKRWNGNQRPLIGSAYVWLWENMAKILLFSAISQDHSQTLLCIRRFVWRSLKLLQMPVDHIIINRCASFTCSGAGSTCYEYTVFINIISLRFIVSTIMSKNCIIIYWCKMYW